MKVSTLILLTAAACINNVAAQLSYRIDTIFEGNGIQQGAQSGFCQQLGPYAHYKVWNRAIGSLFETII